MKKGEVIFFAALSAVCALYLVLSTRMPMGSIQEPGSGFLPVILGISGLLISIGLLFKAIFEKDFHEVGAITKSGFLKFMGYIISIIIYSMLSIWVNTYIAIFVLMLCLTKISGLQKWLFPLTLSILCSVISYLLFELALGVPLPKGLF